VRCAVLASVPGSTEKRREGPVAALQWSALPKPTVLLAVEEQARFANGGIRPGARAR
jgi:hypothetical protein